MKKIGLSLVALISTCYLTGKTFAAPSTDPNLAIRQVVEEIGAQLPQDSTAIALIPLSPAESFLSQVCQVLTSMLASRLATKMGDRFVGIDRADWRHFPTNGGVLSTKQVKQYGKALVCQWLITGRVTQQPNLSIQINLFLWNANTGYLDYWTNVQLPPSAALASLYSTAQAAKREPYYLKWKGLPDADFLTFAIDVADVDGDGFNELIVADEKRVKALSWDGFNFWKPPRLSEIQYGEAETSVSDRTRRTLLAADRDGNDRDEIYIGAPPNLTWQVAWEAKGQTSVTQQHPMFLAQGEDFFIAASTTPNQLDYDGQSTVYLIWSADGIRLQQPCSLPVKYHSIAPRVLNANSSDHSGEIFVIDLDGHLQAYQVNPQATSLIWQTPTLFGEGVAVGDLNEDGVPEIVATVGDLSVADNGEPYDQFVILEKAAKLYTVNWTSPLFEGKIVDLKIADADNDDRNELILCLQNRKGSQILLYAAVEDWHGTMK